jgi:Pentapeptide repeats (8 copies)
MPPFADAPKDDFSGRTVRDRSFRGQVLRGANFSNTDIRGCNFSGADLTGATFDGAIAGQTLRQKIIWVGVAIGALLLTGHPVSRLGFSSLGQTPDDRAWGFVVALCISLLLAGGLAGVRFWLKGAARRWCTVVSGIASGALLGFFYAGTIAEWINPKIESSAQAPWAIAGAVVGSVLVAILGTRMRVPSVAIGVSVAGAIAAYGFALFIGATGITFLSVQQWLGGVIFLMLCGVYLGFTVAAFAIALAEIRHSPGTRFDGAILTKATFANAKMHQTDFSRAIGLLDAN